VDKSIHHLGPVEVGETLCPFQILDVAVKFGSFLLQERQIAIWQLDEGVSRALFGSDLDMPLRNLVAHAP
jgi:hypothetical protein